MEDDELGTAVEAAPPRERVRVTGQGGFVADADRVFLYRVLSLHAKAGLAPIDAAASVEALLSVAEPGETPATAVRRRGRHLGASRLAKALAMAAEGAPEAPFIEHLVRSGFSLTPEETAGFAVPSACMERVALASELFAGVAGFVQDIPRP